MVAALTLGAYFEAGLYEEKKDLSHFLCPTGPPLQSLCHIVVPVASVLGSSLKLCSLLAIHFILLASSSTEMLLLANPWPILALSPKF